MKGKVARTQVVSEPATIYLTRTKDRCSDVLSIYNLNPVFSSFCLKSPYIKPMLKVSHSITFAEGPLAMDNAASAPAARHKGIRSPVPGNVDIYLFPDLESAHLTSQFLVYMGNLQSAGLVTGLPFPVVIRSPLERFRSWEVNLAFGCLIKG